jgi:hypothetical protein
VARAASSPCSNPRAERLALRVPHVGRKYGRITAFRTLNHHARDAHDARGAEAKRSMSTFKKSLMKQGMKLMSDPRVMKLMQDERVMKAVMTAMSVPGKVQSFTKDQAETIAKAMALATEGEVKDLKRTVRRLEEELHRMQKDQKDQKDRGSSTTGAASTGRKTKASSAE